MSVLDKKYYYFIGIGGIGMSALARYFNLHGKSVLGYDRIRKELTDDLQNEGIKIHFEEDVSKIPQEINPENTLVIYTPAVPAEHLELQYFRKNGFLIKKRAEILGDVTRDSFGIAVAGTHGKTTTSSMISHLLYDAGKKCTVFLGGILENYNSNFLENGSEYTVAEADEYDRSFLQLSPKIGVITSMRPDHLDIYGNAEEFKKAFIQFSEKVSQKIFVKIGLPIKNAITYGVESKADYDAVNVRIENNAYHFDLKTPDGEIKDFELNYPGMHNVENATAAIAVALNIGVTVDIIKQSLSGFLGVKRRMNRWSYNGKIFIDDYAHHPDELKVLVKTLKELYPDKKILGVFQPHLYTRTRDFMKEFSKVLAGFDELLLLDIYPAREDPIPGVTSTELARLISDIPVEVSSLENALEKIKTKSFDVVVTAGAGDIDTLVEPIKHWLDEK